VTSKFQSDIINVVRIQITMVRIAHLSIETRECDTAPAPTAAGIARDRCSATRRLNTHLSLARQETRLLLGVASTAQNRWVQGIPPVRGIGIGK
jgi:hypothetical protein